MLVEERSNNSLLQPRGRKDFFHARWLEIEKKTSKSSVGPLSALNRRQPKCIDFATCFGLSRFVIKHELDEKMQISQVKTQKVKVKKKVSASTRPPIALNQRIYKLHLCPQLPPNLVSFTNPLQISNILYTDSFTNI